MTNEYTNEYNPEAVSPPGTMLTEMLEERGMTQAELCERIGRPRKSINEILKGKTAITPDTAIQLERAFGVSSTFWNNRQRQYDESIARAKEPIRLSSLVSWLKNFPCARDMMNKGWLAERKKPELILDAILSYFGVNAPSDWEAVWGKMNLDAALRDSAARSSDSYGVAAYLRKAELVAAGIDYQPYDKTRFISALQKARNLTRSDPCTLQASVIDLCAEAGVRAVFLPLIKGVHIAGAVRWLSKDKPLMVFSCRGRAEDIFWFSFFHEAAHILLHSGTALLIESDDRRGEAERQADEFSKNFLIPEKEWKSFARKGHDYSREEIERFAAINGLSPAIVLGRLQHEGLHPRKSYLNDMKRLLSFDQSRIRDSSAGENQ